MRIPTYRIRLRKVRFRYFEGHLQSIDLLLYLKQNSWHHCTSFRFSKWDFYATNSKIVFFKWHQLSSSKLVSLKFVTSNPSLIEPNCDFLYDVLNLFLSLKIGDVWILLSSLPMLSQKMMSLGSSLITLRSSFICLFFDKLNRFFSVSFKFKFFIGN